MTPAANVLAEGMNCKSLMILIFNAHGRLLGSNFLRGTDPVNRAWPITFTGLARNAAQFLPNTFQHNRDASVAYAPMGVRNHPGMSFGFLAGCEIVIRRP